MISKRATFVALAVIAASAPAPAAVTISTAATENMNCASGTCIPTATSAVLSVSDLEGYLTKFGNVHVATTGNGVEASHIVVKAPFDTPDSTSLTLAAYQSIVINASVSIGSNAAELELQSNKGGKLKTLSFGEKGHVTFGSLSDIFGINGVTFTLVDSVQGLAGAVAANPSGSFALAKSYDASQDGTYTSPPVATTLGGTVQGLGNTISNLQIKAPTDFGYVGLFSLNEGGIINALRLSKASVSAVSFAGILVGKNYNGWLWGDRVDGTAEGKFCVGGIAAVNSGTIIDSVSSATVAARIKETATAGGITCLNGGTIRNSYATGSVSTSATSDGLAGGIAGNNQFGTIDSSFATGTVSGGSHSQEGGVVGEQAGTISNCYSTGAVEGTDSVVGGLIGGNYSGVSSSYSTGPVTGGTGSNIGGFTGVDNGTITDGYWDTDTSGTDQGSGDGNEDGLTGLTTAQLQSGLPAGFDRKIWAEKSTVNNGLPYLIANPPPK